MRCEYFNGRRSSIGGLKASFTELGTIYYLFIIYEAPVTDCGP